MTRGLARLADLAYRRRGRMVLAWIAATVVIIGVGSSLAGRVQRRLQHARIGVQGGERPHRARFDGYSGQEIYVVWKDRGRRPEPGRRERVDAFLAEAEQVEHIAEARPRPGSPRTARSAPPRSP